MSFPGNKLKKELYQKGQVIFHEGEPDRRRNIIGDSGLAKRET